MFSLELLLEPYDHCLGWVVYRERTCLKKKPTQRKAEEREKESEEKGGRQIEIEKKIDIKI